MNTKVREIKLKELREAAHAVILSLQKIPELENLKVTVIGGFAVLSHVGPYRSTNDVDILLFDPENPIDNQFIRAILAPPVPEEAELVTQVPNVFKEIAQPLFYTGNPRGPVQVDIIPQYLPPFLPTNAMTLKEVGPDHLPLLGPQDLLAYKIHCCSMRPYKEKREIDAKDALKLVNMMRGQGRGQGPISLGESQRQAVLLGFDGMIEHSKSPREWWEEVLLGLSG